jgi:hypothetical protein
VHWECATEHLHCECNCYAGSLYLHAFDPHARSVDVGSCSLAMWLSLCSKKTQAIEIPQLVHCMSLTQCKVLSEKRPFLGVLMVAIIFQLRSTGAHLVVVAKPSGNAKLRFSVMY